MMLNRRDICRATIAILLLGASSPSRAGDSDTLTHKAKWLLRVYDSSGVETKWPAGVHVDWETGVPDGIAEHSDGRHTHCSAFVASVAKRLGIYILRPPEHGQVLLANAQFDWLETAGASQGWQSAPDALAAQKAANEGMFVVACYRNHHSDKPGHIAIVRASLKSAEQIATDGPDVTQAGTYNYTNTTLADGFAGHPFAWTKAKEVRFYAHAFVAALPATPSHCCLPDRKPSTAF